MMCLPHSKLSLNGNSHFYYYKCILWQKTLPIQLSFEKSLSLWCIQLSYLLTLTTKQSTINSSFEVNLFHEARPQHFHLTHIFSFLALLMSILLRTIPCYLIHYYLFFFHGSGCGLFFLIEFLVPWEQGSCLTAHLCHVTYSRWCWAKNLRSVKTTINFTFYLEGD